MSVQEKRVRLQNYIRQNPAMANVPFLVVGSRHVSPKEALGQLGNPDVMAALQSAGIDPPEDDWALTAEYYRRLAAKARPPPVIAQLQGGYITKMTPAQALAEIEARTAIGEQLVKAQSKLINRIRQGI